MGIGFSNNTRVVRVTDRRVGTVRRLLDSDTTMGVQFDHSSAVESVAYGELKVVAVVQLTWAGIRLFTEKQKAGQDPEVDAMISKRFTTIFDAAYHAHDEGYAVVIHDTVFEDRRYLAEFYERCGSAGFTLTQLPG